MYKAESDHDNCSAQSFIDILHQNDTLTQDTHPQLQGIAEHFVVHVSHFDKFSGSQDFWGKKMIRPIKISSHWKIPLCTYQVSLLSALNDTDHLLACFKSRNCWKVSSSEISWFWARKPLRNMFMAIQYKLFSPKRVFWWVQWKTFFGSQIKHLDNYPCKHMNKAYHASRIMCNLIYVSLLHRLDIWEVYCSIMYASFNSFFETWKEIWSWVRSVTFVEIRRNEDMLGYDFSDDGASIDPCLTWIDPNIQQNEASLSPSSRVRPVLAELEGVVAKSPPSAQKVVFIPFFTDIIIETSLTPRFPESCPWAAWIKRIVKP